MSADHAGGPCAGPGQETITDSVGKGLPVQKRPLFAALEPPGLQRSRVVGRRQAGSSHMSGTSRNLRSLLFRHAQSFNCASVLTRAGLIRSPKASRCRWSSSSAMKDRSWVAPAREGRVQGSAPGHPPGWPCKASPEQADTTVPWYPGCLSVLFMIK